MAKYSYTIHRPTSVMNIFKDNYLVCIISPVTQKIQAEYLFEEYIKEHGVI